MQSKTRLYTAERKAASERTARTAGDTAPPLGEAAARGLADALAPILLEALTARMVDSLRGEMARVVAASLETAVPRLVAPMLEETVARVVRDTVAEARAPAAEATTPVAEPSAPHEPPPENLSLIHMELVELLERIHATRREIASLRPSRGESDQISMATAELESVVKATESATTDILERAEGLDELADRLRHMPTDSPEARAEIADAIEEISQGILMTCSFQDITGQRINAAINTLLYVEQSLGRVVELWDISEGTGSADLMRNRPDDERPDKDLLHGPQMEGEGVSQADIDALFD